MPYISVESGVLTSEQKKELIERLTATASEITNIPVQFLQSPSRNYRMRTLGLVVNQ